jgi:hypothetical protein
VVLLVNPAYTELQKPNWEMTKASEHKTDGDILYNTTSYLTKGGEDYENMYPRPSRCAASNVSSEFCYTPRSHTNSTDWAVSEPMV